MSVSFLALVMETVTRLQDEKRILADTDQVALVHIEGAGPVGGGCLLFGLSRAHHAACQEKRECSNANCQPLLLHATDSLRWQYTVTLDLLSDRPCRDVPGT